MTRQIRTSPAASDQSLHQAYDTALLDLDGVVYAGGRAIGHAVESLAAARADGMHLAYVTNNALRTPKRSRSTWANWASRRTRPR